MTILLAFCKYRATSRRNSTNLLRPIHTRSIEADAHSPGIMSLDQSVRDSHSHLDEPPFKMQCSTPTWPLASYVDMMMLEWVKDTDDLV